MGLYLVVDSLPLFKFELSGDDCWLAHFEKPDQVMHGFPNNSSFSTHRLNNNSKALLNTLSSSFDRGQKD